VWPLVAANVNWYNAIEKGSTARKTNPMLPLVIFKLIYINLIQEVDLLNRKAKNMKRNISNLIVIVFYYFK